MSIESVPPQSKLILSQILFWFDHIQSKLFNLTFDVFGFSLIELRIDSLTDGFFFLIHRLFILELYIKCRSRKTIKDGPSFGYTFKHTIARFRRSELK